MMITPHILVGAAIGVASGEPVVAFIGGVVSHFALDAIRHTDPGTWHFEDAFPYKVDERDLTVAFADMALAIFLTLYLAGTAPLIAAAPIAGMVGGVLPDVVGVAPLFFPRLASVPVLNRYYAFNEKVQAKATAKPSEWILGVLTQLATCGVAIWFLMNQ